MRVLGIISAILFVATVWLANWLVTNKGVVSVGFGLVAPAGVYAAGLAFTLRDIVHRTLGRATVIGCILAGAGLSLLIEADSTIPGGHTSVAAASAIAFLLSELADLAVYEPLSQRTFVGAVVISNTVGVVIDSMIFLTLAFGSLEFLKGQVVGKMWMTLLALPVVLVLRRTVLSGDSQKPTAQPA